MREEIINGYRERITVHGDSFDSLAFSEYGEEKQAHHIINANPDYSDVLIFDAGVLLKIPVLEERITPDTLPPWRR